MFFLGYILQDLINSMATVLMHFDGDMSSAVGRRMVRLPLQYAQLPLQGVSTLQMPD